MPYSPGVSFDFSPIMQGTGMAVNAMSSASNAAGASISAGLGKLGEGIATGMEKKKLLKEELDALDADANYLQDKGIWDPNRGAEFEAADIGKKRQMAKLGQLELAQGWKEDLARLAHPPKDSTNFDPSMVQPKVLNYKDPKTGEDIPFAVFNMTSRGGGQITPINKVTGPQPSVVKVGEHDVLLYGDKAIQLDSKGQKTPTVGQISFDSAKAKLEGQIASAVALPDGANVGSFMGIGGTPKIQYLQDKQVELQNLLATHSETATGSYAPKTFKRDGGSVPSPGAAPGAAAPSKYRVGEVRVQVMPNGKRITKRFDGTNWVDVK